MATRSQIGTESENGLIRVIYCHWGGYPEGVGRTLLALGNLSSLDARIKPNPGENHSFFHRVPDVTVAYHRDRNDPKEEPARFTSRTSARNTLKSPRFGAEFIYLFSHGQWQVCPCKDPAEVWYYLEDYLAGMTREHHDSGFIPKKRRRSRRGLLAEQVPPLLCPLD